MARKGFIKTSHPFWGTAFKRLSSHVLKHCCMSNLVFAVTMLATSVDDAGGTCLLILITLLIKGRVCSSLYCNALYAWASLLVLVVFVPFVQAVCMPCLYDLSTVYLCASRLHDLPQCPQHRHSILSKSVLFYCIAAKFWVLKHLYYFMFQVPNSLQLIPVWM